MKNIRAVIHVIFKIVQLLKYYIKVIVDSFFETDLFFTTAGELVLNTVKNELVLNTLAIMTYVSLKIKASL